MPKLRFTEATASDAALVARMVRRAFHPQAAILGVNKVDHPYYAAFQTAARVRGRMAEGAHVAIAWRGEEPVGTVTYGLRPLAVHTAAAGVEAGWIERLAVLPEYQRHHHGEALLAHAEQRLRKLGAQTLRLAIVNRFEFLRGFYNKHGYQTTETKQYPGIPFEVEYMEKPAD